MPNQQSTPPRRSFLQTLQHDILKARHSASEDPWERKLRKLKGKIGHDGIERVSTYDVFDVLEVPMRRRPSETVRLSRKSCASSGGAIFGLAASIPALIAIASAALLAKCQDIPRRSVRRTIFRLPQSARVAQSSANFGTRLIKELGPSRTPTRATYPSPATYLSPN
jgi:hypothetical protein